MRIDNEIKLDFKDVLFRPKRSTLASRSDVNLERTYKFLHSKKSWRGIPIISANMDTVGSIPIAHELGKEGCLTALHKFYTIEELVDFWTDSDEKILQNVFYSIGIVQKDVDKLAEVTRILKDKFPQNENRQIQNICIDVANGYSENFSTFIKKFRKENPTLTIMAGNVVTGEMVEELVLCGADIVKIGIGPGSVCTTRKMTGVGYPQLSAIIECADAAHGLGALVCGDGGCTTPGDVAKAFGGGADFVMLGGMLAGHNECNGVLHADGKEAPRTADGSPNWDKIPNNATLTMRFYGMSSKEAMNTHMGGVKKYRASEGKSVEVPYRGAVHDTILEILGGVRSTCTYVGAKRLKELSKRTTFIRVTQQINEIFGKS